MRNNTALWTRSERDPISSQVKSYDIALTSQWCLSPSSMSNGYPMITISVRYDLRRLRETGPKLSCWKNGESKEVWKKYYNSHNSQRYSKALYCHRSDLNNIQQGEHDSSHAKNNRDGQTASM